MYSVDKGFLEALSAAIQSENKITVDTVTGTRNFYTDEISDLLLAVAHPDVFRLSWHTENSDTGVEAKQAIYFSVRDDRGGE